VKRYSLAHGDLAVSRIGYGCMALGGSWDDAPFGVAELRRATELVTAALESGINFFDHADIYARGKSEAVFGEVLRAEPRLRDHMIIQTKCGIRFADEAGPGRYDFSRAYIEASVEASLERLAIEQIDILLLHRPDALMEPEEVAAAFSNLRAAGKVRYFGVSNFSAGQIALLQRHLDKPLVANQLEISLRHHHLISEGIGINQTGYPYGATTGTLDYCRLQGIALQAWTPLARGQILAPQEDAPEFQPLAEAIERMAGNHGAPVEAIALAWLLRHPAGIQPIVGTSNPERLKRACAADAVALTREEWYGLLEAARGKPVP